MSDLFQFAYPISDIDFEKAKAVVSDNQLYKQAGNAIVVDVLYHIFSKLF